MQNLKSITDQPLWRLRTAACLAVCLLLAGVTGCGGTAKTTTGNTTSSSSVRKYFAPRVTGAIKNGNVLLTDPPIYTIDDANDLFYRSTFQLKSGQTGEQVLDAGSYVPGKRSLLNLSISSSYVFTSGSGWATTTYTPAKAGGYALKLADDTGGLMEMIGQPVAPVVAATACPSSTTAQTYLFVSIPGSMSTASGVTPLWGWNPSADTAYGSVDISASGSAVTFSNIKQYTLSTGTPTYPSDSSVTGACGSTSSGYLTVVPGDYEEHVSPTGETAYPAQASIGIGSSGLLVEDNGTSSGANWYNYTTLYENTLGAGTGAIGLPKPTPTSALDTSALVGAQYQGFIYNSGYYDKGTPTAWSSHPASFGFASTPSSCSKVTKSTSTMIYGGEYANGDPSDPGNSSDGYGKCDFAIDLGTPDATSNNGLYPNATVWVGSDYAVNSANAVYHFSAVAIAGKLNGKYAIFLIGADTTQPWAVYLLQSN
jgi:hypothetical protein